jgi:GrpB-like predicted nucleotidyltransferase (UPF0157 family)
MSKAPDRHDSIHVEPYDPCWPAMAQVEIERIKQVITDDNLLEIQHVGSTSVPGAMAKPVIDIYMGVASLTHANQYYLEAITSLGYVFWADNPNPNRLFFVKGMPPYGKQRTHHIHIVEKASRYWWDVLAFRDRLRARPDLLQQYCTLKQQLAQQYEYDREAYTEAKGVFVRSVLREMGISDGGLR